MKKIIASAFLAMACVAGIAMADEASVRKAVEAALPGAPIAHLRKTPYLGLYEFKLGDQLIYTDEKVTYIFAGNVIDAKTQKNLTQERLIKLSTIKFSDLPLDLAVKTVRGNGKRVIATFEDPNCGYCKKLAADLQGMKDLTVYTFLLPILAEDSAVKSRAVWCAADRSKAWNDLMVNGTAPAAGSCDAPLEKLAALGQKLGVRGTPTIFLANGERIPGAISAADLEQRLAQLAAAK
jgi:thiol:disulfide interchange protein DsbC